MILYIAEKPSLAKAIAQVLPKPHQFQDGHIVLGNGDKITWCFGHLLEQAPPDQYDDKYKQWRIQDLPILPQTWKLQVKASTKKQFSVVKKLIKECELIVHAGDPDREGQLLVDEVIHQCKVAKGKVQRTQRCLISDLNPAAVKRALSSLKSNRDFVPLSTSALARSRADWLYGMNLSRICTLQGQKSGFKGVLSVGRVQTPLLGLVVQRDRSIENFTSKAFYEIEIDVARDNGGQFRAKWQPSQLFEDAKDEEGRIVKREVVVSLAERVQNKSAKLKKISDKEKQQTAPLPYSLSSLQIDAAKRFNLNAKQTLDTCQSLYEKHRLITYPRSDCRYLPSAHHQEAPKVIEAISANQNQLSSLSHQCDSRLRTKAWNDKQVGAHHAIIPTSKRHSGALSDWEQKVYDLISRQYLMQFLGPFVYRHKQLELEVEKEMFIAQAKSTLALGWKQALGGKVDERDSDMTAGNDKNLFAVSRGEALYCVDSHILDKMTTPPKRFNNASLIAAMSGIARYVENADLKKILRETDGLGTEATRAQIIELLFSRGFLAYRGKEIIASEIGRALIETLPSSLSTPDMTAAWEHQLEAISERALSYQNFIQPLQGRIAELISEISDLSFRQLQGKSAPSGNYKKTGKKRGATRQNYSRKVKGSSPSSRKSSRRKASA